MRLLLLCTLALSAQLPAQGAPSDPPYPRPSVDPTKEAKEPELPAQPAPERKKPTKERKADTIKKKPKN
ncbi:MAG: hypothetical protein ACO3ND_01230 [Opitutales bacterium]